MVEDTWLMYLDFYFNIGVLLGYLNNVAFAHGEIDANLFIVNRNEFEHVARLVICDMFASKHFDYPFQDAALLADECRITVLVIRIHLKNHLATLDADGDIRHPGHRCDDVNLLLVDDAMSLVEPYALDDVKSVLHVKHSSTQWSTNWCYGEAAELAGIGNRLDCLIAVHRSLDNEGDIVDSAAIVG